MKRSLLFIALVLSLSQAHAAAVANDAWSRNINLSLGSKHFYQNGDDPDYYDNMGEGGFQFDMRPPRWPFHLAIGVLGASGDSTLISNGVGTVDYDVTTTELSVGIRKIWERFPHLRPFVGGGLVSVKTELDGKGTGGYSAYRDEQTHHNGGLWLGGGVFWTLVEHLNLGFQLQYSSAKVEINGDKQDAGGAHSSVLIGYHW